MYADVRPGRDLPRRKLCVRHGRADLVSRCVRRSSSGQEPLRKLLKYVPGQVLGGALLHHAHHNPIR
jgi:hypothetical protein